MAKNKVGVHGTDAETGRDKAKAADGKAATGTKCPITREQFKAAPMITVSFSDGKNPQVHQTAIPREFSSGSLGWYTGDKITVMVDGVPTRVQVGVNLTVVGSKELPKVE
jgi:hypothetical protein